MGEIAEMKLDGILCECCGVYIDEEAPGHPRYCSDCAEDQGIDETIDESFVAPLD